MDIEFVHDGVKVNVSEGPYQENDGVTAQAFEHAEQIISHMEAVRAFAAGELLELYNKVWVDNEIGELDVQGFMRRLVNPSLHLLDELGAATVYFDDSDMFGGHYIEVSFDQAVPIHAGIVG